MFWTTLEDTDIMQVNVIIAISKEMTSEICYTDGTLCKVSQYFGKGRREGKESVI
jgi:hypothetical protein